MEKMSSKYLKGNPKEVNEKTRNGASKSKALESKKKDKDVYGLAKHKKMFDSPEHKKAVAEGKSNERWEGLNHRPVRHFNAEELSDRSKGIYK